MPRVVPSQVVALIDQLFPWASSQGAQGKEPPTLDGGQAASLAALVELVEQIPGELLRLDSVQHTGLMASVAAIKNALEVWRNLGASASVLKSLPGFKKVSPVTMIRRALQACPDEAVSSSTTTVAFIQDVKLREELRSDISAVDRALTNGDWKAATILAGAVIEALLLWALQQRTASDVSDAVNALVGKKVLTGNPGPNLEVWTLAQYIEVSAALGIIRLETATAARLAKDFRNLIHPGRAVRLQQTCSRGTALSAVAAVEHVVRDLTP